MIAAFRYGLADIRPGQNRFTQLKITDKSQTVPLEIGLGEWIV